jgi:hypothetical protein
MPNGNTSHTVVNNALEVSKYSGNAYIGTSKTFTVKSKNTNVEERDLLDTSIIPHAKDNLKNDK